MEEKGQVLFDKELDLNLKLMTLSIYFIFHFYINFFQIYLGDNTIFSRYYLYFYISPACQSNFTGGILPRYL